jgi:chaperonin GroES
MPTKKLIELAQSENIAADLGKDKLAVISNQVLHDLDEDTESMKKWLDYADQAIELTKLERQQKDYPYRHASNVKFPLISTAAIQFSSRTLPELIKNGEVVKYKIIGRDPNGFKMRKGDRLKTHLNYQILEKMPNWLDERDKLLTQLAVIGTVFVKTWFDPLLMVNRSELIPYNRIIINNSSKSLELAPRISEYVSMPPDEMIERMRYGLFREVDIKALTMDSTDPQAIYHELIEQHTRLDLDDDGYPEPYIVTVHKASGEVLRIVARYIASEQTILYNSKRRVKRIIPMNFYTDYHFLPNPDGTFLSLGFGTLLLDMNKSVNTILNQLIDAGSLANTQAGIIGKDLRLEKEDMYVEPGEWIFAQSATGAALKDSIVPFTYKEPSLVLFQLLGTIIESAKELTSTTEALTGMADTTNTSPNTLAGLIDQGLKVYSAIQRRISRGFKKELQKIVELNSIHLNQDEYETVIDPSLEELQEMIDPTTGRIMDYDLTQVDIVPVADGNMATETENKVRAQSEFIVGLQLAQLGAVNPRELARSQFIALQSPNIDKLVMPEPDPNAPNPEMIALQAQLDMNSKQLQLKDRELKIKEMETTAKVKEIITQAVKNIADAEAAEAGTQLSVYQHVLNQISTSIDHHMDAQDMKLRQQEIDIAKQQAAAPTSNG